MAVPAYDEQPGFHIDATATSAYRQDIETALCRPLGRQRVVELGCGSGEFTTFLASHGLDVTGVDRNEESLAHARRRLPKVPFLAGDIESPGDEFVARGPFDLLVARYVIHELADPVRAFRSWLDLLSPRGRIVLIENCWIRSDWGHSDWGRLSDDLPLACTQTWATAAYLLGIAGITVSACRWMDAVNGLHSTRMVSGFRLFVIAAHAPVPDGQRGRGSSR